MNLAYYSKAGNTRRLVENVAREEYVFSVEPPEGCVKQTILADYILFVPTYQEMPEPVTRFLTYAHGSAKHLRGIVGVGNRAFGSAFCLTAHVLSDLYRVPIIHEVEVFGTPEDVQIIREEIARIERN